MKVLAQHADQGLGVRGGALLVVPRGQIVARE